MISFASRPVEWQRIRLLSSACIPLCIIRFHIMDRYINRKYIGAGGTGIVLSAIDQKIGEQVALKVMDPRFAETFEREVNHLSKLKHKNIIKLRGQVVKDNIALVVVTEKMDCDLFTFIDNNEINENVAVQIFTNLCEAVQHCHEKKIAHLDIKPENILLSGDGSEVRLSDFGGSAQWSKERAVVFRVSSTKEYSAPEVFHRPLFAGDKADIWSLGIVFHILLAGCWPFEGETEEEMLQALTTGRVEISSSIPRDLAILIQKILSYNPENRPSAHEILLQLKQPSLQSPKQKLMQTLSCGYLCFS